MTAIARGKYSPHDDLIDRVGTMGHREITDKARLPRESQTWNIEGGR
jgi:hypothetical protein